MAVTISPTETDQWDPATDYILYFKNRTESPVGLITTTNGASVPYVEATSTLNKPLIFNQYFMDTITHLNRERIPERVVHTKGAGAFGYFEVTHDISQVCKASFLSKVGKKTPVAVRFSSATGERGISDLNRDFRGFAVKFYTEEGNFDIPGINTPIFFSNDPINFMTFAHASRRNPATNLFDIKTFWDVVTVFPESLHMFIFIFADRGIPASYRNMPGFGVHTYQVENKRGDKHFVRFHILPDAGIKGLGSEKARNISATDPDYLTRDLFRAIGKGDFPSWTVNIQILTEADVEKLGSKAFDTTRVIPIRDFPLHPVGKLYLNRNPKNFHAEIEQLAFCPANLISGICGGPDKLYEARRMVYRDTQMYRLGVNFNKISVNCPFRVKTFTFNRDGLPPVNNNEEDIPNYYPNSFNGPIANMENQESCFMNITEQKAYNFDQSTDLYVNELKSDERMRLIKNVITALRMVTKCLQEKAIKLFTIIHPDFGKRVAQGLHGRL